MSTENPYAPPQAEVADVAIAADQTQSVTLWTARGRIGRVRLLAFSSGAYLISWILMALTMGLTVGLSGKNEALSLAAFILMIAMGAVFFVFSAFQLIKRCHDLDWNGWLWLIAMVPFVNFIFLLILLFAPGTKGVNNYGAPPPPNRAVHWVLATVMPVMVIIGIFAAIAIPQYQGYVERARAEQSR